MKSNRNFRLYSSEEQIKNLEEALIQGGVLQLWQREKNAHERKDSIDLLTDRPCIRLFASYRSCSDGDVG